VKSCMWIVIDVDYLKCGQKEADTRLLFHAARCTSAGFTAVMIVCEDTDVFILCAAFSFQIPCPMYTKNRTKTRVQ